MSTEPPVARAEGALNRGAREALIYAVLLSAAVILYLIIRKYGDQLAQPTRAAAQLGVAAAALPGGHDADVMVHILLALSVVIACARPGRNAFSIPASARGGGRDHRGHHARSVAARTASGQGRSRICCRRRWRRFWTYSRSSGSSSTCFWSVSNSTRCRWRRQGQAAVAISHASIVTPFLLGTLLALLLYPEVAAAGIPFTGFSLFIGVSMSVTAFPVLSRILTDLGINKTPLGVTALTCAAVDDVTAWCLLAVVVGVVEAHGTGSRDYRGDGGRLHRV